MKTLKLLLFVSFLAIGLFSCQKENPGSEPDEILINQVINADKAIISVDHFLAGIMNIQSLIMKSAITESQFTQAGCPAIIIDKNSTPWQISLDFGTGCKTADSTLYSGKIVVNGSLTGNEKLNLLFTFINFSSGGYQFSGDINKAIVLDANILSGVADVDENVTLKLPDNKGEIKYTAKVKCRYNVGDAGKVDDDTVVMWGEVTSVMSDGVEVDRTVAEGNPLVYSLSCKQFVSGVASFKNNKNQTWSIDFGKGECDNTAVYTDGSITRNIQL